MKAGHIHVHTRASDGDITPQLVVAAGLGFVVATDHDTLDGHEVLRPAAGCETLVIPGVELTVRFEAERLHVLVIDPEPAPGFAAILAQLQAERRQRAQRVREQLEQAGLDLSLLLSPRKIPTKREMLAAVWRNPDNAGRLRTLGIADVKALGRRYVVTGERFAIAGVPADEALPLTGGALVLAHPARSLRLPEQASVVARLVRRFAIAGIEALTRKHTPDQTAIARGIARELGVVAVTSNDAHDPEHLADNQTPPEQLEQLRRTGSGVRSA